LKLSNVKEIGTIFINDFQSKIPKKYNIEFINQEIN